jgi:hypothetical protein
VDLSNLLAFDATAVKWYVIKRKFDILYLWVLGFAFNADGRISRLAGICVARRVGRVTFVRAVSRSKEDRLPARLAAL